MAHRSHFKMSKEFEKVSQFDESYLLDHLGDYLEEPFKLIESYFDGTLSGNA